MSDCGRPYPAEVPLAITVKDSAGSILATSLIPLSPLEDDDDLQLLIALRGTFVIDL